jgi:hypothetical protein
VGRRIHGRTAALSAEPLNVVVGAGDMIGASPMISSLFHDEPAVETLNRIGLEFNAWATMNSTMDRQPAAPATRRLQDA